LDEEKSKREVRLQDAARVFITVGGLIAKSDKTAGAKPSSAWHEEHRVNKNLGDATGVHAATHEAPSY